MAEVGLQLYTVRNDLEKDFEGTMARVAEIGYGGVEFAGYGDRSSLDIARVLKETGLRPVSAHVPLDQLESDLEACVEFNLEVGNRFLVVPSLPEDRRNEKRKWKAAIRSMNSIAEELKDYGLTLCYHNHDYEMQEYDGQTGFEILLDDSEPEILALEMDVYWIQKSGANPAEYILRAAGRCPLVHLKDLDKNGGFVEVGEGELDLDSISAAAEGVGAEWFFVEQDECSKPPLESAKISYENLKKKGLV